MNPEQLDEITKRALLKGRKSARGHATYSMPSTKKNHHYIKTDDQGTLMVPAGELEHHKPVKEEVEPLDELSNKTLKSYVKKSNTSAERLDAKGDKEEDKAMSTDGNKYPEKQARHQAAASKAQAKSWNRRKGIDTATKKLKEDVDPLMEKTKDIYAAMKAREYAKKALKASGDDKKSLEAKSDEHKGRINK